MNLISIVLQINNMQCISIFWIEIMIQLILGIVVGASLALIGYYIWKKQNIYSKKFEVYIDLISRLNEVYRIATDAIIFNRMLQLNNLLRKNETFFYDLQRNKLLFVSFFGEEYYDKIQYFIEIEKNIKNVSIEVKEGSVTLIMKYTPDDYTSQILNSHNQTVINTMAQNIIDLKSVSMSLKKYIL